MNISMNRQQQLKKELKRVLNILKKDNSIQKIILFGSLANGKIKQNSDIDLLIVKNTKKSFLNRIDEIVSKIHPRIAMDIFVLNGKEVKKKNPYIKEIFNYGVVVHEK